jgi:hypothetical protein
MKHGSGMATADDGYMKPGFCAGPTITVDHLGLAINHNQLLWPYRTLVDPTGSHQQAQGVVAEGAAEIAARPFAPATPMDRCHRLGQLQGLLGEGREFCG